MGSPTVGSSPTARTNQKPKQTKPRFGNESSCPFGALFHPALGPAMRTVSSRVIAPTATRMTTGAVMP